VVVVLLATQQFLMEIRLGVMELHHSSPILELHQLLPLEVEAAVEVTRFHATVFQVVLEVAAEHKFQMVQMEMVERELSDKEMMVEVEIINQDLVDWLVVAVVALELLVHQVLMDILLVLAVMVHHHQSLDHQ